MVAKVKSAFETGDPCELSRHADQVLVLREAVLDYLTHIGRSELSDGKPTSMFGWSPPPARSRP